jgi:formylglycine-generating enzyme required for sulfatase activity
VSEFADKRLARLNAPINDVTRLQGILQDASRGCFDSVELSPNEDFLGVRRRLSRFYHQRAPEDLLLLYYSGHGIFDRRLYLATTGSQRDAPREESISAHDIREFIADSRAQKHIVILDCCHSGAFAELGKTGAPAPAITSDTFASAGTGLYVLAAADKLEIARDGDQGANELSLFTSWLVDALENGSAAPDEEHITIDALYQHLFRRARSGGAPFTPQRFVQEGVGDLVISANPLAGSSLVNPEIVRALRARQYLTRMGAVHALSLQILEGSPLAARGARRVLQQRLLVETHYQVRPAIERALAEIGSRSMQVASQDTADNHLMVATRSSAETQRERGDLQLADLAVFRDTPFAPDLVVVPTGEFWMGSPEEEEGRDDDEGPRHRVTIEQRFAIGRYPVTFEEYDRFCEARGRQKPSDEGWDRGRQPVINVSWNEAQVYIAWLSEETSQVYRLPSEAEWEYACRAGTTTRYSFGDSITPEKANYADSGLSRTSEVGVYPPNSWGLHDIHGNVWEWVEDDWHENYQGAPSDGSAWRDTERSRESRRCMLRGGSWGVVSSGYCRSACRSGVPADLRHNNVGFRVARTLS